MLSRTTALLGEKTTARITSAHVVIIGTGGVGGWCAEALVRSGLGAITLVDDDVVVQSNLNRQSAATVPALGRPKVEALKERLLAINPKCRVNAIVARYPSTAVPELTTFDFVVDAIDSVAEKSELICAATEAGVPIVSSMGAALRTDPTKVEVRKFDKVEGDGLARALRQRFKRNGRFPAKKFACVCSIETPRDLTERGSYMPVVCTFGMCLAAEVIGNFDLS